MNQRKTVIFTLAGLALASGLLIAGTAPVTPAPAPAPVAATPAQQHLREAVRGRIIEKLGLSADQQKKMDTLRAERDAAIEAIKADKNLSPDARHEKARAVFAEYQGRMMAELTPEQRSQAAEMRKQAAKGMQRHMGPPAKPGNPGQMPHNPLAIVAMGEQIKDRIAEKLQLTDEQRDKLEHLGRAYRAQQRELAKKHHEEMRAVLTPEQLKKADAMKKQMKRGPGGPGGPARAPRVGFDGDDIPDGPMVAANDDSSEEE